MKSLAASPPGSTKFRLYRRTEAHLGETCYLGVELGAGSTPSSPPPAPTRRIGGYFGDSISAADTATKAPIKPAGPAPDTENHYATQERARARNLQAELITVAWSGKGAIFNYGTDRSIRCRRLTHCAFPCRMPRASGFFENAADVVVILTSARTTSARTADPSEAEFSGVSDLPPAPVLV